MHVGQPEVAALEAVGQLCVVYAKAVQQRGLEIVNVDRVFGDVVAVVVGCAMHESGLDAAASHPN